MLRKLLVINNLGSLSTIQQIIHCTRHIQSVNRCYSIKKFQNILILPQHTQSNVHTLWTLFLALWSYLYTSYPENDGSPFASYIFSSPTGDVCSPALHVPLQLPPACWGWDWCRMPLRVPQAHQGVSPHVCVPLLRLGTDGLGWPIGFNVAGHLLAVPHQALLHKIFLHPCLPGKKKFQGVFYTSFILLFKLILFMSEKSPSKCLVAG